MLSLMLMPPPPSTGRQGVEGMGWDGMGWDGREAGTGLLYWYCLSLEQHQARPQVSSPQHHHKSTRGNAKNSPSHSLAHDLQEPYGNGGTLSRCGFLIAQSSPGCWA